MASKPKYTQEICKLSPSSTRLKEQVAGRLLHYWKEDLKGGKSKICAVFLDGQTFQNVLTAEAWSEADQAHTEKHPEAAPRASRGLGERQNRQQREHHSVPRKANQLVVRQIDRRQEAGQQRKLRQSTGTFDNRRMLQATLTLCHFLGGLHPKCFWTAQSCD